MASGHLLKATGGSNLVRRPLFHFDLSCCGCIRCLRLQLCKPWLSATAVKTTFKTPTGSVFTKHTSRLLQGYCRLVLKIIWPTKRRLRAPMNLPSTHRSDWNSISWGTKQKSVVRRKIPGDFVGVNRHADQLARPGLTKHKRRAYLHSKANFHALLCVIADWATEYVMTSKTEQTSSHAFQEGFLTANKCLSTGYKTTVNETKDSRSAA